MKIRKKFKKLGRKTSHRKSLLVNLSKSIIIHKRIVTTIQKAKSVQKFIEPILTKIKKDTTHSRRIVFSHFQDKEIIKKLFNEISNNILLRNGGYTRTIRIENRKGDNSEMCIIELVNYNQEAQKKKKIKTRRSKKKVKNI